jgi:hypothetical protein
MLVVFINPSTSEAVARKAPGAGKRRAVTAAGCCCALRPGKAKAAGELRQGKCLLPVSGAGCWLLLRTAALPRPRRLESCAKASACAAGKRKALLPRPRLLQPVLLLFEVPLLRLAAGAARRQAAEPGALLSCAALLEQAPAEQGAERKRRLRPDATVQGAGGRARGGAKQGAARRAPKRRRPSLQPAAAPEWQPSKAPSEAAAGGEQRDGAGPCGGGGAAAAA